MAPQAAAVGLAAASPAPGGDAPPAVVQVRCPTCGATAMVTPGQTSFCFSCGQVLPGESTKGGGGDVAPGFRVDTTPSLERPQPQREQPAQPGPPRPGGANVTQAIGPQAAKLRGSVGEFTIAAGPEIRVGRDPSACSIFLGEPRVSGVHATLKLEAGRLLVRDETSNNGTWVFGERIAPGTWTPLPPGAPLRFGPVEFTVQLEVP